MSINKLPSRVLNTTIDIYEKSFQKSDVGDFNSTADVLKHSLIPATIQQDSSGMEYQEAGVTHYQTHIAYLNLSYNGEDIIINVDNLIIDNITDEVFTVISVEKHTASAKTVTPFHHYRIVLEQLDGFRDDIVNQSRITSKARIS